MNSNASRSPRSLRLLTLTVAAASVALFGAIVVADGFARLLLGGVALVTVLDVVRELRTPGAIERQADFDARPSGPWIVGMIVFVVLNVIAFGLIRDRTRDDVAVALLGSLSFGVSYGVGQLVRAVVSRLPRYRAVAGQR